jgi:hypothetical protein
MKSMSTQTVQVRNDDDDDDDVHSYIRQVMMSMIMIMNMNMIEWIGWNGRYQCMNEWMHACMESMYFIF